MIDYSVFMMGNPMDVDAAQKAYAKAQVSEIMPFSQFVKHIADHNGVFTRGTVKGVIADMCECLVEMLLEGKKVQLAELGNFWISIGSEGAEDLKKFTESNITAVNVSVKEAGKPDIFLEFKLRKNNKTGEWKAFDMVAEGISLLSAKQSELGGLIRQNGIDAVIAQLREHNAKPLVLKS